MLAFILSAIASTTAWVLSFVSDATVKHDVRALTA